MVGLVGQGQTPSAPVPFRTHADYVSVPVVVTDSHGDPVADLTKGDFEVVDGGRAQNITGFEFVSVPRLTRKSEEARPEPDVFTNRGPAPTARRFVIVVDDLHLLESQIVAVRRLTVGVLEALSPDDEVAVTFTGRSDLSQSFTTSTGRVLAALARVREAVGAGLDAASSARVRLGYARSAVLTLKNVVTSLAITNHSQRAIVYVSNGFGAAVAQSSELLDLFEQARRANVFIYTLDPRGLISPEEAVRGGIGAIDSPARRREIVAGVRAQQETLAAIAINTGGRAFFNNSDLRKAVTEIVADTANFYLLGYYPDPFPRDGKFHPISVKVNRSGLRVRARPGYIAPSASVSGVTLNRPSLATALRAGDVTTDLSLRAVVVTLSPTPKTMTAAITLEVTYPNAIEPPQVVRDTVDVSVLALDPDGRERASQAMQFQVSDAGSGLYPLTFVVNANVRVPARPLVLRIGVASKALGKMGTLEMPLEVLKPFQQDVQLSGLVVGSAGPFRTPVVNADAFYPAVPFQPSTTRTFTATEIVRVFALVLWKSDNPHATVTLRVKGNGINAVDTVRLTSVAPKGNRHQAALNAPLPLRDLMPGEYMLDVSVQGLSKQPIARLVRFSVR